jgi:DNA adenine methylase
VVLRPFLKWVGGKRQLLPVLRRFYPAHSTRYIEPFLGSAAVFLDQLNTDRLNGGGARLGDGNAELIGCYRRVADSLDRVLAALEPLARGHAERGREHYMEVRDQRFNPLRAEWREGGAVVDDYTPDLAAMLIYLNRTGYNGLFRQNASGLYNVPPGRYDSPRVLNQPLLTRVSAALNTPGVELVHAPFERLIADAQPGEFVYLDPPYAPMSATANFRGYTGRGFSDQDQRRLQQAVIAAATRGVHVLLSNSVAPSIARLYEQDADVIGAGLRAYRVPARRSVNSRPDRRGAVEELVVSNVPPRD